MSAKEFIRGTALSLAIIAFTLVLSTCGNGHRVSPSIQSGGQAVPTADSVSLNQALAELEGLQCPEGVDAELWRELKDALGEALVHQGESRLSSRDSAGSNSGLETPDSTLGSTTARFVSAPPIGEANCVTDLTVTDEGGRNYVLSWHYRNLGDYDQNGTIGISDLTPIAVHYGETYDPADVNCIQAVVDGSGNLVVDIADITPIAANFGTACAGYRLEQGGVFTLLCEVSFSEATGEGRLSFTVNDLSAVTDPFLRVVPYDGEGTVGEPSDPVERPPECWHLVTVDSEGNVGRWSSLAVVNDCPAISYYDGSNADLKYVRANDPNGRTWGEPVTVDSEGEVGGSSSLIVLHGKPAISYHDGANETLKFVRANDEDGADWAAPVSIDGAVNVDGRSSSLTVVRGYPAVSYYTYRDEALMYVRANNASGSEWREPVMVDSGWEMDEYNSLAVVNGKPAISYYSGRLRYVRAMDVYGDTWGEPAIADGDAGSGYYCSLSVVNDIPAISYFNGVDADLNYVRATDTDGDNWGDSITVDIGPYVGQFPSLVVVNGNPAISYYEHDISAYPGLYYVRASDPNGDSWDNLEAVDTTSPYAGYTTSLAEANGKPAISYHVYVGYLDLRFAIYY